MALRNDQYKELERKQLASTKWIKFQTILYTDRQGVERSWDMCSRATKTGPVDAGEKYCVFSLIITVDVLAVLKKAGEEDKLVIELQYRYL